MSAWDWNKLTPEQRQAIWQRERRSAAAIAWALAWAKGVV